MGRDRRLNGMAMRAIFFGVAQSGLPPERQKTTAIYLLVTGFNVPGAAAAAALGCSKQNVSKLLRKVEDRREDAAFDAVLSRLEREVFGEESF